MHNLGALTSGVDAGQPLDGAVEGGAPVDGLATMSALPEDSVGESSA
jgi:hypothetical protein